jgi:single-stranded-DNA-specific exonuclease
MGRQWKLAGRQEDLSRLLSDSLNVHPVVGDLLVNRGIRAVDEARRYLSRRLGDLHDPETLPGVAAAADRIHQAVLDKKKICIYGDYDVDGMCATAILLECLRIGGAPARFYVPDRVEEGYGLSCEALTRLRAEGIDLVVTVDCGIASVREAEHAKSIGLDLVITDHHEFAPSLPPADVLVHPRLPGAVYPFGELCGAGVAFKLAWEVARRFSGARKTTEAFQKFLLDATSLAAVGTVCDVVPLVDENRVLVHHGLTSLKASPPLGLARLMTAAGLDKKPRLDSSDVGFSIGPRLNACGRLGTARLGVELLTTRDASRADELVRYLEEENKARQTLERRIFLEARELAEAQYDLANEASCPAIVLASEDWHPGVIGIVASRDREGAGSGRSIPALHLQEALAACEAHLISCGGHAMAAGLRIDRGNFEEFRDAFHQAASARLTTTDYVSTLSVDVEVPLHILSPHLIESMDVLAPFGATNPSPLFLASNLMVDGEPRKMGGGERHLSFYVRQGDRRLRAVAFGQAERAQELISQSGRCCLVFSPRLNTFRGFAEVELLVRDFRPGASILEPVEPQVG